MVYKIEWLEKKNEDWLVLSLSANGVSTKDVSVNRKNKKGEIFPNFDQIQNGGEVEGELWQSAGGKWYLFAPKPPKTAPNSGFKAHLVEKAQERKESGIARFQGEKELSIKIASTFSQSCALAVAEFEANMRITTTGPTLEQLQQKWRKYLWNEYDKEDKDFPPFA